MQSDSQPVVRLKPLAPRMLARLWAACRADDDRPVTFATKATLQTWWSEWAVSESLGFGAVRAVLVRDGLAGIVTFSDVGAQYHPNGEKVVECGTYLLPPWRGSGIHREVKRLTLEFARHTRRAQWLCFVIPSENQRAVRAFVKLGWTYHEAQTGCTGGFKPFTERKTWELGRPCNLFWVRCP